MKEILCTAVCYFVITLFAIVVAFIIVSTLAYISDIPIYNSRV